jgi:glycosyltransferase involved in cell wall biosynthesis
LETYNEERAIGTCLENLSEQGVETYLCDESSTDRTLDIAKRYLGRGLTRIQRIPYPGKSSLRPQLKRKEELSATLVANWFIRVDADEILLPPRSATALTQAFGEVEGQGYNAVNFLEFYFIPTQEPMHGPRQIPVRKGPHVRLFLDTSALMAIENLDIANHRKAVEFREQNTLGRHTV